LPPTWMIFTKHLELGALLTPSLWLRGGIGPARDATVQVMLKPYVNASIMQQGESTYGVQDQIIQKHLIIYPFRAINLPVGQEWSIGIQANRVSKMTSTALSLSGYNTGTPGRVKQVLGDKGARSGVVEYRDYVGHFSFGLIDQRRLLKEPIYVVLFLNGYQQVGATAAVYCQSIVNGECEPGPLKAYFTINGQTVTVQMTAAWDYDPHTYLLKKVRALSVVFPQFALHSKASADFKAKNPDHILVRFKRNGRVYDAPANWHSQNMDLIMINTRFEQNLGVQWIMAWDVKYGQDAGQEQLTELVEPQVELIYVKGGQQEIISKSFLPEVDWSTVLRGDTVPPNVMGAQGHYLGNVRVDLMMDRYTDMLGKGINNMKSFFTGDADSGNAYITGVMGLNAQFPIDSSRWIYPSMHVDLAPDTEHMLYWSIEGGVIGQRYNFNFSAYKLNPNTGDFEPTALRMDLANLECLDNSLNGEFPDYGNKCHFQQNLKVLPGLVGLQITFKLRWINEALHITEEMMSPVVSFVAKENHPTPMPLGPPPTRRLEDLEVEKGDGVTVVRPPANKDGVDLQMESVPLSEATRFPGHDFARHISVDDISDDDADQAAHEERRLAEQFGISHSNIDFNKKLAELHPICVKKDLAYKVSYGLAFRAIVHTGHFVENGPGGVPAGLLANIFRFIANFDTGDINILQKGTGNVLDKVLPKEMCRGGVCQGILPGCPGKIVRTMTIPRVEFELNRNFHWTPVSDKNARTAVAYATALFPEALRVGSLIVQSIIQTTTTTKNIADLIYEQGSVVWKNGHVCRWIQRGVCQEKWNYKGRWVVGCTMEDHNLLGWCSTDQYFNGNWRNCYLNCGGQIYHNPEKYIITHGQPSRKLAEDEVVVMGEKEPRRLAEQAETKTNMSNRFVVDFDRDALHYNIDQGLIRSLLARQAFRGINDEQGEAKIVAFKVHTGDTKPGEAELEPVGPEEKFEYIEKSGKAIDTTIHITPKSVDQKLAQYNAGMMGGLPIAVAVVGAVVLAALSVKGWRMFVQKSRTQYATVEANEQPTVE